MLPGHSEEGVLLADNKRLRYKLTGVRLCCTPIHCRCVNTFCPRGYLQVHHGLKEIPVPAAGVRNLSVTLAVVGYFGFYTQQLNLAWIHTQFIPLLTAAVLFSFALSACLYLASFRKGALLAKGGNTGDSLLPAQVALSASFSDSNSRFLQ